MVDERVVPTDCAALGTESSSFRPIRFSYAHYHSLTAVSPSSFAAALVLAASFVAHSSRWDSSATSGFAVELKSKSSRLASCSPFRTSSQRRRSFRPNYSPPSKFEVFMPLLKVEDVVRYCLPWCLLSASSMLAFAFLVLLSCRRLMKELECMLGCNQGLT